MESLPVDSRIRELYSAEIFSGGAACITHILSSVWLTRRCRELCDFTLWTHPILAFWPRRWRKGTLLYFIRRRADEKKIGRPHPRTDYTRDNMEGHRSCSGSQQLSCLSIRRVAICTSTVHAPCRGVHKPCIFI